MSAIRMAANKRLPVGKIVFLFMVKRYPEQLFGLNFTDPTHAQQASISTLMQSGRILT